MKLMRSPAVLGVAWLPAGSIAMCYAVYGANQVVIWRGGNTPIDLSKSVEEGMRRIFPAGSFLVMEDDDRGCTPIGTADFFGPIPGLSLPARARDPARPAPAGR